MGPYSSIQKNSEDGQIKLAALALVLIIIKSYLHPCNCTKDFTYIFFNVDEKLCLKH